jgi:glucan 1,3-beta-glucosidase
VKFNNTVIVCFDEDYICGSWNVSVSNTLQLEVAHEQSSSYLITDTLRVPKNVRIVGEVWSVIVGGGPKFNDQDQPQVVVRIGEEGDEGVVEISDIIFATRGPGEYVSPLQSLYCLLILSPAAGAIVVEINVHEPVDVLAGVGMWDSHIRSVTESRSLNS